MQNEQTRITVNNPELATVKEACAFLNIGRTTLYDLMNRGIAVTRKMRGLGRRINLPKTQENLLICSGENGPVL